MLRFASNISLMYREYPFLDRFSAARDDGFDAVECQFPYDHAPHVVAEMLGRHGLTQVLFNAPPGDMAAGERGTAALPGREGDFRKGFELALDYARALACSRIHVMAGVVQTGADIALLRATYLSNLAWAADRAISAGVTVMIEPINTQDMPGYLLNRQEEAHAIVAEVGAPHLQVQMDLYHCQIVEGDVDAKLRRYLPTGQVGHLQIAGVPGRHEPEGGELDFPALFKLIDALGYDGHIGCEYLPRGGTSYGLAWLRAARGW